MKYIKIFLLIIFLLVLVMLDTSFFSFISLNNATIISSFAFLICWSLNTENINRILLFSSIVSIIFSILSSLPVIVILSCFFLLPISINFIKKNYFSEFSLLFIIMFLIFSNLLFDLILLVSYQNKIALRDFSQILSFITINGSFQIILVFSSWVYKKRTIKSEIKL